MISTFLRRGWLLGFVSVWFVVATGLPALGHADFVSVTPADGSVSHEPIERFELVFTAAVEPVDSGIRLLSGADAVDVIVFQPTDDTVVVEPVEPLTSGRYALFWKVQSADAHVVEGTAIGEVVLPAAPDDGGATGDDSEPPPQVDTAEEAPPTTIGAVSDQLIIVNTSLPPKAFETAPAAAVSDAPAGDWMTTLGRWVMMIGGLIAIGAFVFAGTSLVGTPGEVRRAVRWVRRGGVLVLVGSLVEVMGASTTLAGSLADALTSSTLVDVLASSFGVAVLLQVAGGIALLQDPKLAAIVPVGAGSTADVGPGVDDGHTSTATGSVLTDAPASGYRLDMKQEWVTFAGVLAVAASFTFNGHTASVDPSLVAKGASFVHVLAGGVWFGGLIVMADTLTRRRRSGVQLDAAAMALRFSRSALVALATVAVAGVALTWTIIESPSDLVSGAWARLLLIKVGLVGVVALLGAYNHFKVIPLLDEDPNDEATADRLRRVVLVEAAGLAAVIATTAVLVGAAT